MNRIKLSNTYSILIPGKVKRYEIHNIIERKLGKKAGSLSINIRKLKEGE